MINPTQLKFVKLQKNHLRTIVEWAKEEGWNPGIYDFEVFWETDPNGFYGFFLNDDLIAGGAIVSYNQEFGFMGLFIVKKEFRGYGIGRKLWYLRRDQLIERLKKNAPIGMDGVVEMQPFYEKGGFKKAYREERYECRGASFTIHDSISEIKKEDFKSLVKYDSNYFGYERKEFLMNWINLPESKSFKFLSRDNHLLGYAQLRKATLGYKIGPLFADHYKAAESLYRTCLNAAIGEKVYLDIPVINKNAVQLMKQHNAKYTFECARMYYGKAPEVNINNIYGVTSFELG